jgi:cytochrome c-type biogenesis protein CcmF
VRLAAAVLLVVLAASPALAQTTPRLADTAGQELNARGLHVLVYHPYPDPQGDPWGFPERERNGTAVGYMEGAYGAYWYPTTVIDGFERVEGATSFLETFNTYSDLYLERAVQDSPFRLFVHGALADSDADVTVKAQAKGALPSGAIDLRVVLFEDEVRFEGGNGVDTHRFVVRAVLHDGPLAFNETGAADAALQAALDPTWDRTHLGVVASLHNRDVSSAHYRPDEVYQATTYRFGQVGPTIQDRRGVLLETLSGTWCDACVYGDGAVDELANEYGIASSAALRAGTNYLRPFAPVLPPIETGTWETGLLLFAFLALLAAFATDLYPLPVARRERLVRRALVLGVGALTVALALLTIYFLAAHLSIEYVFSYTRRDYPWYYRLAGLWGGQKGTLLMWAAFTGLFGLGFLRRGQRAADRGALPVDAPETLRAVRRALLLVLLGLSWSTLVARTFAPTSDYLLRFRPDGNGLQPVLLTPFMVIHPPIQFLSYALTGILFSAGLAHVATGGAAWAPLVRPWARLNWLLATIGLGLGGLWAYYVLNFGGFWAWDPVETANLLAWFPLTLLLHSLLRYERGEHRTVAPLFALLALPMALFSTVATRTGLWVSVHAFTDPTKNFARDALARLLNILGTSDLLRLLVALLALSALAPFVAVALGRVRGLPPERRRRARTAVLLAAGLLAFALLADPGASLGLAFQAAHAATLGRSAPLGLLLLGFLAVAVVLLTGPEPPAPAESPARGWRRWMETGPLLTVGLLLLGLAFLAIFLLDVGGVNGYDRRVFDERAPFVALPILLVLAAQFLRARYTARTALGAAVAAGALGLLLAWALPAHRHVLLVLPALLLVAAASLLRFVDVSGGGPLATRRDRAASLALILGGLVAFFFWGNPPSRLLGLDVAWGWAVPACLLALLAILGGALHAGRPHPAFARAAALALVPLVGPYGLATALGLVALALVGFSHTPEGLADALRVRRGALRKSSVYLLHLGLALGLTGYALATYESVATEPFEAGPGAPAVRGYTFEPLGASFHGRDPDQGLPLEVHAQVRVLRDGTPIDEATLVYWLVRDGTPGHYDARVTVVRLAREDLYVFPEAVELRGQNLTDHVNGATPRDPTLDGLRITVKVLPGVGLVWGGLWLLGASMTARLLLGGFEVGASAPERRPAPMEPRPEPAPRPPPPVRSD